MKNTFFYQLFSTFSPTELRALRKFVASPYFNGRPRLVPLLDYFSGCLRQNTEPEARSAFAAAFPDEPFEAVKYRLSISQLFKLCERFAALRETETESSHPLLHLAKAYRRRGLHKHFERTLRALDKKQDSAAEQSAERYEDQYLTEWEKYQFLSAGRRTENFNLQSLSDSMDAAFVARKLRHACFSLSHQAVFKTEYEIGLLPEVLALVGRSPALLDKPAIQLYYHCYLALTEQTGEAHFEAFKKMLFAKSGRLPTEEQRNLFLLAINYGIRQINAGHAQYDRPVLDLYRTAHAQNLLLLHGVLSHFAFNNMVAIGVRIGETDWVENFIHENKKTLERKHRNVAVSLGLARLEHGRKNYREALLHLQKSDYTDFINNLIAKVLQLKIYFETGETEVLEAHLRNMKNYIRRKRAFGYHRENYLNIIRFTQALNELNPFDKKEKEKLREEIRTTEPLTEREWLEMMASK